MTVDMVLVTRIQTDHRQAGSKDYFKIKRQAKVLPLLRKVVSPLPGIQFAQCDDRVM